MRLVFFISFLFIPNCWPIFLKGTPYFDDLCLNDIILIAGLWEYGGKKASSVVKSIWKVDKGKLAIPEACELPIRNNYGQWCNIETPTVSVLLHELFGDDPEHCDVRDVVNVS